MAHEKTNKPIETKQFDRVHAALWKQQGQGDAPSSEFWTLTLSRSFKNDKGEWQKTNSFTERDLPHLVLAVDWAMKELLLKSE